jgi:hypothetical protein
MNNDKQYLISEKELQEFINPFMKLTISRGELEYKVEAFLKSKQPVQTLDRDKVEDILHKNTDHPNDVLHTSQYFKVACEICNLAVPEGEVIAEGKVVFDEIAGVHIGNKTILYMDDELSDYEGKTIQIIIKEVGDDKL